MGRKRLDLVGKKFGRLVVLRDIGTNKRRQSLWLCRCDCGNERILVGDNLKSGRTKSCGCLNKEKIIERSRLDLIGQKFGRLTVLRHAYTRSKTAYWLCKCDCGNKVIIRGYSLRGSNTKSCGCLQKEHLSIRSKKGLVGKRFGKLLVLEDVGRNKHGSCNWICKCDCGNKHVVESSSLISGNTQSCGCLQREKVVKMNKSRIGENGLNYKHGMAGTRAYRNQKVSEYKATKRSQTPVDANIVEIQKMYSICQLMNEISISVKWHVDHIIPLSKGGLHHQDNLQILEASANMRKSNKIIIRNPAKNFAAC